MKNFKIYYKPKEIMPPPPKKKISKSLEQKFSYGDICPPAAPKIGRLEKMQCKCFF